MSAHMSFTSTACYLIENISKKQLFGSFSHLEVQEVFLAVSVPEDRVQHLHIRISAKTLIGTTLFKANSGLQMKARTQKETTLYIPVNKMT